MAGFLWLQAEQCLLCGECRVLDHTKAQQATLSCPTVFGQRGTQPLGMGEKQTREQPPIPVLEGRVGAELDRAQGGDLRAMVNSLCKQLSSERTQLSSGRGAAHPGRRKSRVPADDSEPGSPRPLPLCSTAALPRGPSTPATLTHSLPCTFQECPAGGKWDLPFQGERAAPGGCRGRWGSSACGSWLWLLQDAVTLLVVFPGLLSLLGTFLHLQLYVGRTAWGFPDSAITIILLGNFSAGAHGWEGAASPGFAVGHSLHPSGAWQCLLWLAWGYRHIPA